MNNAKTNYCRKTAKKLDACANGELYICPDCGSPYYLNPYFKDVETYNCNYCGESFNTTDVDPFTIANYFTDYFDIEYRINGKKELKSVCVKTEHSNPSIYIDTGSGNVELYEFGKKAQYALSVNAVEAINDHFEFVYNTTPA